MYVPNKFVTLFDGTSTSHIVTGVFYSLKQRDTDSVLTFDTGFNLQDKKESLVVLKTLPDDQQPTGDTLVALEEVTPESGEYLLFNRGSSSVITFQPKGHIYNNNTLVTRTFQRRHGKVAHWWLRSP